MNRPHLRPSDYDNSGDVLPDGYNRLKDGTIVNTEDIMNNNKLWDMAYKNADNNEFLRQGLDMMRNAGYIIEYDEVTNRFTCIPPEGVRGV